MPLRSKCKRIRLQHCQTCVELSMFVCPWEALLVKWKCEWLFMLCPCIPHSLHTLPPQTTHVRTYMYTHVFTHPYPVLVTVLCVFFWFIADTVIWKEEEKEEDQIGGPVTSVRHVYECTFFHCLQTVISILTLVILHPTSFNIAFCCCIVYWNGVTRHHECDDVIETCCWEQGKTFIALTVRQNSRIMDQYNCAEELV